MPRPLSEALITMAYQTPARPSSVPSVSPKASGGAEARAAPGKSAGL